MSHDDDDWDMEVASGIFEFLFWYDGRPNWFVITLFIIGLGLLGWHCAG